MHKNHEYYHQKGGSMLKRSQVKLFISRYPDFKTELACELVNDGVQLLGGNGYMKDYGQEKRYRDARQV